MPLIPMTTKLATICYLSLSAEAFSSHYYFYPQTTNPMRTASGGHSNPTVKRRNTATTTFEIQNFASCNPLLHSNRESSTAMKMSLSVRGGAEATSLAQAAGNIFSSSFFQSTSPLSLFNKNLLVLALATVFLKLANRLSNQEDQTTKSTATDVSSPTKTSATAKPAAIQSLQIRFLLVFWLLRCADWLQGPYFYQVYSSKVFQGVPASLAVVSNLFLTGFASTALFGPLVGRWCDSKGRKRGTLLFAFLYSLGAASTKSQILWVLLMGRVMSGIGTSLLFSAPESWLVGEAMSVESGGSYLGETFGLAYAGDALVAILAGQLAGAAAGARGPSGPFELSIGFLAAGAALASFLWKENKAEKVMAASSGNDKDGNISSSSDPTIRDALKVVMDDPKIMLVGAVQSLFEAAMYIFVLQWPPAVSGVVAKAFGGTDGTPYGTVFSCFMASCLLGSTIFGQLVKRNVPTETSTSAMLTVATVAMGIAAWVSTSTSAVAMPLAALVAAFFAFEGCVGMYFPSIGTLRSKYVPDSHRSVIMNLFGIPLNVLVVSVFLSIKKLGVSGALSVSTGALALATASIFKLKAISAKSSTS